MLSDRIGRKPLLLGFSLGFAVLAVPLLHLVTDSFVSLLLVQCAGMVLLTGYTAIAAAVNAEVFPPRVRAAGIGFPYSLTVALFGGTAPYVGTLVQAGRARGALPLVRGRALPGVVLCLSDAAGDLSAEAGEVARDGPGRRADPSRAEAPRACAHMKAPPLPGTGRGGARWCGPSDEPTHEVEYAGEEVGEDVHRSFSL